MIVLHQKTRDVIDRFIDKPPHSLLLTGPRGMGKTYVAQYMLSQILGVPEQNLWNYQYGHVVASEKSITIEQVRSAINFVSLKTIGKREIRRFIFIEQAETMTIEAQNALLKLLEEPPADTIIVLTASQPLQLLPTIRSRCQELQIIRPDRAQLLASKDSADTEQSYALSGGLPGLFFALVNNDKAHPLYEAIQQAKALLRMTSFERLAQVDQLAKQKQGTDMLLFALQQIAQAGLVAAAHKESNSALKQWHHILTVTTNAQESLASNAQAKLILTNLMLSM